MYPIENSSDIIKNKLKQMLSRRTWTSVGRNVFFLGLTSFFTDVSSEMVTAILPLYLVMVLQFVPLQFGFIDGINQGISALVRIASGLVADRWRRPKEVATAGYAFSAICRIGLLIAGRSWLAISGVILLDRIGKGIRTAPRDAMIAGSVPHENLGTAFGVHRAMDTAGAMLGPLLAAGLLFFMPGAYDSVFVVSLSFAIIGVAVISLLVEAPFGHVAHCARLCGNSRYCLLEARAMNIAPAESSVVSKQVIPQLLSMPNFRSLILISSVLALTTLSDNFLYLMMQIKFGFELSLFPLLYVGTALSYMILAIPIGRLSDQLGRRNVFIAGYGLLAIVYGLLLSSILPAGFLWLILLFQGLFYAATDGVLAALASAIVPEQWRTTGLAVMTTGTGIARLLASIAYGALWTFMGPYQALSLFLGGLFITMILVLTIMNRVEGKVDGTK